MKVNLVLSRTPDAKLTPDSLPGELVSEPVFFAHTTKSTVGFLTVAASDGAPLGNYILQLDGRTGRLSLIEKKPLPRAPYYSASDVEDSSEE